VCARDSEVVCFERVHDYLRIRLWDAVGVLDAIETSICDPFQQLWDRHLEFSQRVQLNSILHDYR
jgi:hypothetical protein